jgi:hypothetical protein
VESFQKESQLELQEFSASGLDGAMELMSLATTADSKKASERLDRHPERRVKSAYAAYEERELPILKAEHPGLRLTQLKQQLQKTWKKSPENPMVRIHDCYSSRFSLLSYRTKLISRMTRNAPMKRASFSQLKTRLWSNTRLKSNYTAQNSNNKLNN